MTATALPNLAAQVESRRIARAARVEVLDSRGHPSPPEEIVRRLPKGVIIEWVPGQQFGVAYFGIFTRWAPGDPRWERVRTGELPESKARDMVQMFPRECAVADMAAYIEHRWGERNRPQNASAEADRLVAEQARLHEEAIRENTERAVEGANERSARSSTHELALRAGVGEANAQVTVPVAIKKSRTKRMAGHGPKRLA